MNKKKIAISMIIILLLTGIIEAATPEKTFIGDTISYINGRLGIGTTTPTSGLDVQTNMTIDGLLNLNNVVYVDSKKGFENGIIEAHNTCGDGYCKIIFSGNNYTLDTNINLRSNTDYEGSGSKIIVNTDLRVFRCLADTILNDVSISGFNFIDSDINTQRTQSFIHLTNCNITNVEIKNNHFINRSATSILFGHSTAPIKSVSNVNIHNNVFLGIRTGLGYEGDLLRFTDNFLDATGSVGVSAEREGLDYNRVSNYPYGVGTGFISNNIFINFTEQGIDANVPNVIISGNYIKMKPDGATTTGINSYANYNGIVTGNTIEMSTESTDKGIKALNSNDAEHKDKGQIITGNRIIGSGAGQGIQILGNNILVSNNYLQNTSIGIDIQANNTNVNGNHFSYVTTNINDSGLNNGYYLEENILGRVSIYQNNPDYGLYIESNDATLPILRLRSSVGGSHIVMNPHSSAPATCIEGEVYVDTSGAFCYCYTANTWDKLGTQGTCA